MIASIVATGGVCGMAVDSVAVGIGAALVALAALADGLWPTTIELRALGATSAALPEAVARPEGNPFVAGELIRRGPLGTLGTYRLDLRRVVAVRHDDRSIWLLLDPQGRTTVHLPCPAGLAMDIGPQLRAWCETARGTPPPPSSEPGHTAPPSTATSTVTSPEPSGTASGTGPAAHLTGLAA